MESPWSSLLLCAGKIRNRNKGESKERWEEVDGERERKEMVCEMEGVSCAGARGRKWKNVG